MRRSLLLFGLSAVLLIVIGFDLVPALRGPAPFPDEWQWPLQTDRMPGRIGWALIFGGGLLGLLALARSPRMNLERRWLAAMVLLVATALGVGLQLGLLRLQSERSPIVTLIGRTYSPHFTSYYTVAMRRSARSVSGFLEQHANRMGRLPNHAKTHPPGPVLYYRGALEVSRRLPALTDRLVETALDAGVREARVRRPGQRQQLAAAFLGAAGLMLAAAATCFLVTVLASRFDVTPRDAVSLGILWCLIPAPLLMTPEMDQLLTFLATLFTVVFARAVVDTGRRGWIAAGLAGLVAGAASFVSYGAAVFLSLGGLVVLAKAWKGRVGLVRVATRGLTALAGFAVFWAVPMLAGHDSVLALRRGLSLHRRLFTEPRSFETWLVHNLVDLVVFLGIVLAALIAMQLIWPLEGTGWRRFSLPATVVLLAVLGLDLSGITRGEVGRIWMPLMPLLLIVALERGLVFDPGRKNATVRQPLLVGSLLLANCLVIALCWKFS